LELTLNSFKNQQSTLIFGLVSPVDFLRRMNMKGELKLLEA